MPLNDESGEERNTGRWYLTAAPILACIVMTTIGVSRMRNHENMQERDTARAFYQSLPQPAGNLLRTYDANTDGWLGQDELPRLARDLSHVINYVDTMQNQQGAGLSFSVLTTNPNGVVDISADSNTITIMDGIPLNAQPYNMSILITTDGVEQVQE